MGRYGALVCVVGVASVAGFDFDAHDAIG